MTTHPYDEARHHLNMHWLAPALFLVLTMMLLGLLHAEVVPHLQGLLPEVLYPH